MSYIHEAGTSDLKSIMDMIVNFKNKHFKTKSGTNYLNRSSISRASKDLIASFPVICSDTISPDIACMVSKATERNDVVMLQLLFSSAYLKGTSGREVLSQWHNNMDKDIGMDELFDIIDTFGEDAKMLSKSETVEIMRELAPIIESNIRSMNRVYPKSSFSKNSISAYMVMEGCNGDNRIIKIHERKGDDYDPYTYQIGIDHNGNPLYTDSFGFSGNSQGLRDIQNARNIDASREDRKSRESEGRRNRGVQHRQHNLNVNKFEYQKGQDTLKHSLDTDKFEHQKQQDRLRHDLDIKKNNLDKDKFEYQKGQDTLKQSMDLYKQGKADLRDSSDFFTKQLMDSDAKKFNELVPSLLILRFQAVSDEDNVNAHAIEQQCIIGVKTRLIPVNSFDIIDHCRSIEKNKISLVNLVRATTKEISFTKDFVAALDQAKIDAKQNSKLSKSSPIWRALQSRSMKSNLNRLKRNRANDAGAITTLIVSIEEVNVLKKDFDIDLTKPQKAKFLMEQYNLLCFVIVDEQIEIVRFLYDGEKYFQDYAFNQLERETGDSSYKKVINLISKINRG